ncbi:hypothetical protein LXL04_037953 [Taraxacum kok-saghyz]
MIERIGSVAHHLELPPESRVHPVFHVSLLRQAFGDSAPTPLLDFCFEEPIQELEDDLHVKEGQLIRSNSPAQLHGAQMKTHKDDLRGPQGSRHDFVSKQQGRSQHTFA